jgi:hypothetical protein
LIRSISSGVGSGGLRFEESSAEPEAQDTSCQPAAAQARRLRDPRGLGDRAAAALEFPAAALLGAGYHPEKPPKRPAIRPSVSVPG